MTHRREARAEVAASPEALFSRLDDQTRLAGHMAKPSMMMGGGRMTYEFDDDRGRAVGSRIRMGGKAFGIDLSVEEVVTDREPPRRKVWRTVGKPRLLVIGGYEMGFEIGASGERSTLRVWIDYELPGSPLPGVSLLAELYARWCVERMVADALNAFGTRPAGAGA